MPGRAGGCHRVHIGSHAAHTHRHQCAPELHTHIVHSRLGAPSRRLKAADLFTTVQVTTALAHGPGARPSLHGQSASLAGLGPGARRWRGHDHPLAEVAPGGPFVPGADEVTLHGAATV